MTTSNDRQLTQGQLDTVNGGGFASSFAINPYFITDPLWSRGRLSSGANSVGRIGIAPLPSP